MNEFWKLLFYETGTGTSLNGQRRARCHVETSELVSGKKERPINLGDPFKDNKGLTSGDRVVIWFNDKSKNAKF